MVAASSRTTVLLIVGLALLVAPAATPLDPVLRHDTHDSTFANETRLEEQGYTVVAYENLSERGQTLYVRTLREGGRYTAPNGTGAPEFPYPSNADLRSAQDYETRESRTAIVIERPPNASLPPADERVEEAAEIAERLNESEEARRELPFRANMTEAEIRAQIERYDVVGTRTVQPELTARPSLLRFASAALGVLAIGLAGYFSSKPT